MMLRGRSAIFFVLTLLSFIQCYCVSSKSAKSSIIPFSSRGLCVKVMLAQVPLSQKIARWQIASPTGFTMHDPSKKQKNLQFLAKELAVVCRNGMCFVNGRRLVHDEVQITTKRGVISFEGKEYHGSLLLKKHEKTWLLINTVGIEEYVCSVLRTESWPGWPLEVNKVFAVASRTYVVSMALQRKKTGRPYDVTNTNTHQTYSGTHTNEIIKKAVAHTRGLILGYNNAPIIAMFDSCCGGIIPAHISNFNFEDAPYLARSYACKHCKRCKIYSWQAEYTLQDFEQRLKQALFPRNKLRDVRITKMDKAGLVNEVKMKCYGTEVTADGKKMYSLLKEVKSYCFNLKRSGGKITLLGRGYGHHIGLCQWGAREMVRDGWHFRRILQFYYPGTQFMRLT